MEWRKATPRCFLGGPMAVCLPHPSRTPPVLHQLHQVHLTPPPACQSGLHPPSGASFPGCPPQLIPNRCRAICGVPRLALGRGARAGRAWPLQGQQWGGRWEAQRGGRAALHPLFSRRLLQSLGGGLLRIASLPIWGPLPNCRCPLQGRYYPFVPWC